MKHTKAPWTFTLDEKRQKALIHGCAPQPRSNEPIQWFSFAEVCIAVSGQIKEEGLANLALFLAAPDVLKQLHKVTGLLESIAIKGNKIDKEVVEKVLADAEDAAYKAYHLQWTVGED